MNQGFGREKRLLDAKQFKAVFDSPDYRLSGRCLLVLARHNQLEHARLGLVVGKKNSKLAVTRNRIKRVFRDYFRLHQNELPSVDMVIITRRGIADLSASELRQELARQVNRLLRQSRSASTPPSVVQAGQSNA
ncbi:ribonuclease P protein component [Thiopseudomonas denitrificans]|uniref:Ribonuclease P protein component n=1 Tax=Thiopseudomonas denitrificans TaxID=1501432 RepID=A0A4R6TY69_9GAMM|nr:ribonuclease P protein component [Thiopseudomonas denitrificans]TDQ37333.1 ribonuclease P protein component [Thiopseudomonas denitrificans]